MNDLNYKLNKYYKKIYDNFIIYSSHEFKDKWILKNNYYNNIYGPKVFIRKLVDEMANVNKNLLKSLFIFSIKYNFLFLSNLIYEKNRNEFINPLLTKNTKTKSINIKKKNIPKFVISSCFTPPNELFLYHWNKKVVINNLDNYI